MKYVCERSLFSAAGGCQMVECCPDEGMARAWPGHGQGMARAWPGRDQVIFRGQAGGENFNWTELF